MRSDAAPAARRLRRRHDPLRRARLDRRHVAVGEPEMMADLVHQHMRDDGPQRLVVVAHQRPGFDVWGAPNTECRGGIRNWRTT